LIELIQWHVPLRLHNHRIYTSIFE